MQDAQADGREDAVVGSGGSGGKRHVSAQPGSAGGRAPSFVRLRIKTFVIAVAVTFQTALHQPSLSFVKQFVSRGG